MEVTTHINSPLDFNLLVSDYIDKLPDYRQGFFSKEKRCTTLYDHSKVIIKEHGQLISGMTWYYPFPNTANITFLHSIHQNSDSLDHYNILLSYFLSLKGYNHVIFEGWLMSEAAGVSLVNHNFSPLLRSYFRYDIAKEKSNSKNIEHEKVLIKELSNKSLHISEAARLIYTCYQSHVDSKLYSYLADIEKVGIYLDRLLSSKKLLTGLSFTAIDRVTGDLLGVVLCQISFDKKASFITQVVVRRDFQGYGIGSLLVQRVITSAKREKITCIDLVVSEKNVEGIELYKKNGFLLKKKFESYYLTT